MRVIIAGSRDFDINLEALGDDGDHYLQAIINTNMSLWYPRVTTVVSGCARGIDKAGEAWAAEVGLPVEQYPAEVTTSPPGWNKWGKGAGFMRNTAMAKNADALLAIWNGHSRGTKHMIEEAIYHRLDIVVKVIQ